MCWTPSGHSHMVLEGLLSHISAGLTCDLQPRGALWELDDVGTLLAQDEGSYFICLRVSAQMLWKDFKVSVKWDVFLVLNKIRGCCSETVEKLSSSPNTSSAWLNRQFITRLFTTQSFTDSVSLGSEMLFHQTVTVFIITGSDDRFDLHHRSPFFMNQLILLINLLQGYLVIFVKLVSKCSCIISIYSILIFVLYIFLLFIFFTFF